MKSASSVWLVLASAIVGGAVGTAGTLAVRGKPAPEAKRELVRDEPGERHVAPAAPASAADDSAENDLRVRVRSLEQRVSLLTAALAKNGLEPPRGAGEGAEAAEDADVASPVFEAAVRDILDRVDDEQREERQARRGARMEEGAREISAELAAKLGLSAEQQQKLQEITKAHFAAFAAMRDEAPENRPKTPEEWRERRNAQRTKTDEAVRALLTPEQMRAYEALPEDERLGGGRPWSRGRGDRSEREARP
jgi:hypothetical protein